MTSNILIWGIALIALIALIWFLVIVLAIITSHNKSNSEAKKPPTIDYQISQADHWTELYFKNQHHPKKEVGRMYERYIGYLKEQEGYSVEYHGINLRFKDNGIDLICKKGNEVLLVQCKRLSHTKEVHEDVLNKLRGSLEVYKAKTSNNNVKAEVCSSAQFGEDAIDAAKIHNITISVIPFDASYPSFKCNIYKGVKHFFPIYHPIYDKISINPELSECYCKTAQEAYEKGFQPVKIPWIQLYLVKQKIGIRRNIFEADKVKSKI